jgi:HTH-type transcriptional regulator/antitoxin HigA
MQVKVIRNDKDHAAAVERMDRLMETDDPSNDAELEALGLLVENYESKKFPFEGADPVDVIRYKMGELALSQAKLAQMLDVNAGRLSEFLSRKRRLTLPVIRAAVKKLRISPNVLIKAYDLVPSARKNEARVDE